jgi:hypothetical protein
MSAELIVGELLGKPSDLKTARRSPAEGGLPAEDGFYAWWTRRTPIHGVPPAPHPTLKDLNLFYVGIAPRDERSTATVRSRVLGNHLSGNTGSSTFRFTLAALLMNELDLRPRKSDAKVLLPPAENRMLSEWQDRNLYVAWARWPDPWILEAQVISRLQPPLNLASNSSHPFFETLRGARARFRAAAR